MPTYVSDYDFDADGIISIVDIAQLASRYGSKNDGTIGSGGTAYNVKYDLDKNGVIDLADLVAIAAHFLAAGTPTVPPDSTSLWLQPINVGASTYTAAQITGFSTGVRYDVAFVSVSSAFPLKTLTGTDTTTGQSTSVSVRCDPNMSHDGSWNGCARFLAADGSLWEGQPLSLTKGGNPHCDWLRPLAADQIKGCHGGSGLSMGGTLTKGWTTGPIGHALGINVAGWRYLNPSPPYVSPAWRADSYWNSGDHAYAGTGPIHMGSRLALKAADDISAITDPTVILIANALITYGAYICDDAWDDVLAPHVAYDAEDIGSDSQLITLFKKLWVVT